MTTRPAAAPADWLDADDFVVAELEPMTPGDVQVFVHRWHEAMREQCPDAEERDRLTRYESLLLEKFTAHRHLRRLAGYPLLCALLCALHRDRRGDLPANRMELYRDALQTLLDRRDRERQLAVSPALSQTEKTLLLRDVAYWLIRNGWSSAPVASVQELVAAKLSGMTVDANAAQVYRVLLERSGLLREPVEGQVDFVHRSFQEYLAAAEAADVNDIGMLVKNAHDDGWHEVVVLAAGHASLHRRVDLLTGILDRASKEPRQTADTLRLVALACLDTSPELPRELRERIRSEAGRMIPPKTMTAAQAVAKAGDLALDLLIRAKPPRAANAVAATIRAAADIGDPAALPLLAKFGTDRRKTVVQELHRAWSRFDPEEYARTVLPAWPLDPDVWFEVTDSRLAPALRHLRGLRRLWYTPNDAPIADLAFVAQLPALEHLWAERVADLRPIGGLPLRSLACSGTTPDEAPLSLAPLAGLATLEHLVIDRPFTDAAALRELPNLSSLHLHAIERASRIADLRTLTDLEHASFGGMPDLFDLSPLHWLAAPHRLWLENCPNLTDLTCPVHWQDSLHGLVVKQSGAPDLAGLGSLRNLEQLFIIEMPRIDLNQLPELPALTSLDIVDSAQGILDLSFLRRLPVLKQVVVFGVEAVDARPLAGRSITIAVPRGVEVIGADGLRPRVVTARRRR